MNRDGDVIWIFDCPIHGSENAVFCFRAFDTDNIGRWAKYAVHYEVIATDATELRTHLVNLRTLSDLGLNPARAS